MSEKIIDHIAFRGRGHPEKKPAARGICLHCKKPGAIHQRGLCWRCSKDREIRAGYPILPSSVPDYLKPKLHPGYKQIELLPDDGTDGARLAKVDEYYNSAVMEVCEHGVWKDSCPRCELAQRLQLAQRADRDEDQWDDNDYSDEEE